MSDLFINTLDKMAVGEQIVYYAASPASRDKVISILSSQNFSVNVQKQGSRRFKIIITRVRNENCSHK